jgi:hypothetical protein
LRYIVQHGNNSVSIFESAQFKWAAGEWYEIMVTFDYELAGDNVKIYINGQLDSSYDENRLLSTNDLPIIIGGGYSSYYDFPGTIDEVLIHNKALEPDLNNPPDNFDLISPIHNSNVDTLNFTFTWQEPNDIDGDSVWYKFYLSDDYTFDNIILNAHLDTMGYYMKGGLDADSLYYWKVVAVDEHSAQTTCSKIFTFRTRYDATQIAMQNVLPDAFELAQNYPNPFNPTTTIHYALPKDEQVILNIYNINGILVKTVVSEKQKAGRYSVIWNGKNNQELQVPSGVYLYKIHAGNFISTRKMSLIK